MFSRGKISEVRPTISRGLDSEVPRGALLSDGAKGVGVAINEFDYIDARKLFGERTITVNATLVVTTVCT